MKENSRSNTAAKLNNSRVSQLNLTWKCTMHAIESFEYQRKTKESYLLSSIPLADF